MIKVSRASSAALAIVLSSSFALAGCQRQQGPEPLRAVTLARTECKGTCPDYTLSVARSGLVTFEGRKNVVYASAQWTLDQRTAEMIMAKLAAEDLSEADSSKVSDPAACPPSPTDLPGLTIQLITAKQSRTFTRHPCLSAEGRRRLGEAADLIDRLANAAKAITAPAG